jgi:hypothetical protein
LGRFHPTSPLYTSPLGPVRAQRSLPSPRYWQVGPDESASSSTGDRSVRAADWSLRRSPALGADPNQTMRPISLPWGEAHLVSAFFSLSTEAENTARCRRFRWGCWDRSGSSHVRTRLAGGIKPMQCPSSIGIKFARRNRHRDWEGDLRHNTVARRGCFAAAAPRNTVTARSVCR